MARKLVAQQQIDVVHQPIPVSPKESSLLYDLGAPLVIGPMNGGMSYPPASGKCREDSHGGFMRVGRAISGLLNRLMRESSAHRCCSCESADEVCASSRNSRRRGRAAGEWRRSFAMDREAASGDSVSRDAPGFQRPSRGLESRRYPARRNCDCRKSCDATLDILGDGAMRPALEAQCKSLQLTDRVKFHGWVPQTQLAARLREADILVLPSLYECGGAVVLEAMAAGIPVIASELGRTRGLPG